MLTCKSIISYLAGDPKDSSQARVEKLDTVINTGPTITDPFHTKKNTKEPISDQTVKNPTPGFHIAGEG